MGHGSTGRSHGLRAALAVIVGIAVSGAWGVATDDLELAALWRWSVAAAALLGTMTWAVIVYSHERRARLVGPSGHDRSTTEVADLVEPSSPPPVGLSTTMFSLRADNRMFTNRDDQVAEVHDALRLAGGPELAKLIFTFDGLPGVGKTAVALHIAGQLAPQFERVLWQDLHGHTPGRSPADASSVLTDLLAGDGMAPSELPADLDSLARIWRSRVSGRRVLLVLDDALDDTQVEPLLPGAPGFVVLVTSRRRLTRLRSKYGATVIPVDVLSERDAVVLFSRVADRPVTAREQESVAALVQRCGRLPLAIALLAAGLQPEPGTSLTERLAELDDSQGRLSSLDEAGDEVVAAFDLSYSRLPPEQQLLFRQLSLTPGTEVDSYAASALAGRPLAEVRGQLRMLYGYRLLERTGDRYRMHDLTRDYARRLAEADATADRVAAVGRLLGFYQQTAAGASGHVSRQARPAASPLLAPAITRTFAYRHEAIAWLRAELREILACAEHSAREDNPRWLVGLASAIAPILRNDGHWHRSIELHQRAVAAARKLGDPIAEAAALNELGVLLRLTGDTATAAKRLRRARALYRHGGDRLGEAQCLNDLGVVVDQLGDSSAARACLVEALHSYRELGNRLGEANVLHDFGVAESFAGNYADAIKLGQSALACYREVGSQLGEAHALTYLASAQRRTGELSAAADNLQRSRVLYRDLGNQLGEAHSAGELAIVWRLMDKYEQASETLVHVLGLHRELGSRRGEAQALAELGVVRGLAGDGAGALEWLRQSLSLFQELQNPRGEVEVLGNLGKLSLELGHTDQAKDFYVRALSMSREVESARDEANALLGLARTARAEGRFADAAGSMRTALGILNRIGAAEETEVANELAALTGSGGHEPT